MKNEFYCLIGRDSRDNEQRELSPGTSRFFSEKLHTLNYTNFLLKVRDGFLGIERGEGYYEHKVSPRSFFYCPLTVSDGKPDAAAVWGECGFYGGGREFRYAHFYLDNYRDITPRELLCRVFTSEFLDGDSITAIFDRDRKAIPEPGAASDYDENFAPEIPGEDRALVCEICEKLCDGSTVVVKLGRTGDFNKAARGLLVQIMSLLPGEFRKQIGFATYLQPKQIKAVAPQSNNLRLIIADSDVELGELEGTPNLSLLEQNGARQSGELYEYWSRLSFSERELQAERFKASKKRIPGAKLLCELARLYKENGLLPEPVEQDTVCSDNHEAHTESAKAQVDPVETARKDAPPENSSLRSGWFLAQKEVRMIAAAAALIGLLVGLLIGKLI